MFRRRDQGQAETLCRASVVLRNVPDQALEIV
jgi:hypothetical protein